VTVVGGGVFWWGGGPAAEQVGGGELSQEGGQHNVPAKNRGTGDRVKKLRA